MPEWLYGRHAVEEALRAGRRKVFRVLLAEAPKGGKPDQANRLGEIETLARKAGAQIERVPSSRLDVITKVGHHHQGVAAEVTPFQYATIADTVQLCRGAGNAALALILDTLQDPQNFGTLLRSSEAAGVTAIV